jgi:hypothetical protein
MAIFSAAVFPVVRRSALALAVTAPFSLATSFAATATCVTSTPIAAPTTATQTVGNGNTCTVTSAGAINVSSGSNPAVTMAATGSSPTQITLVNSGTIQVTNGVAQRAVQTSGTNQIIVIQNNANATIHTVNDDTVAVGTGGSNTVLSAQLINAGTIQSDAGGQAVNFNKILSGTNSITNSGLIQATNSDAVRPGVNGTVGNTGTILSIATTDTGTDGIDAQQNSGVIITNAGNFSGSTPGTGTIEGARHGITGGNTTGTGAFGMTVTNNLGGVIKGDNGSGINIDGINGNELVTITNHGSITGNGVTGDGDGVDVDGLVNLMNTGTIHSLDAHGSGGSIEFSEGVTVGGGTITNTGTIQGSVSAGNTTAIGRGITIAGIDTSGSPAAPYAATTITNSGLIRGDSDSGIIFSSPSASGFSHTITNQSGGVIQTGSTTAAAILTSADAVTINNSGQIDGSSSGVAIKGGTGNLTINVAGNSASILGSVQGGSGNNTLTMDLGSGNSFAYAGSVSGFNTVEVKSGHTTLSGVSTYNGATKVTGGTLTLDGANRIAASSALVLGGGTLQLAGIGGANGQTFASLSLTDNSTVDLDSSSLTFASLGSVTSGRTLSVIDWSSGASPDYAFRLAGDETQNAGFLGLVADTTIDGVQAGEVFDGQFTDVRPVPIPASGWMLLTALGLFGTALLRRTPLHCARSA